MLEWSRRNGDLHRHLKDRLAVNAFIEKFREKYGAKDVKKYYSKFDVAVVVELT